MEIKAEAAITIQPLEKLVDQGQKMIEDQDFQVLVVEQIWAEETQDKVDLEVLEHQVDQEVVTLVDKVTD